VNSPSSCLTILHCGHHFSALRGSSQAIFFSQLFSTALKFFHLFSPQLFSPVPTSSQIFSRILTSAHLMKKKLLENHHCNLNDLQRSATKDNSITHAAAARNIDD
jgi:hypothetical protein